LLGKLRGQQGSHGFCRKGSVNSMNKGSIRMSKMKEEARTTEENKLKRVTDKVKKEYLESICDETMGFERTGYDVLMCMKTKELDGKENHGIQTTNIEDFQGNIKVEFNLKRKQMQTRKVLISCTVEWEKLSRR
jgi:hypothetical protein